MRSWLTLALLTSSIGVAAVKTENVPYAQEGTALEGFLAYDDANKGPRPGILVVHEYWGINDHIREVAKKLAAQGYVVFAADIYGKGVRPTTPQEASKVSGSYKSNPTLLRARAQAGLDTLKKQKNVDPDRIAAVGFCFGGTTVLELARSGAPLKATASVHGGLATKTPEDAKNIKGRVLVLHGAADGFVKPPEVAAFEREMDDAKVDWTLVKYGGAAHAFTNPMAGNDPSKGAAYDPRAAERAMEELKTFFASTLKP